MDQTISTWLREILTTAKVNYIYPDRTFYDIDATLKLYKTLAPKVEPYTYDTGLTQLLICLHGTLPITYRSSPYYIPVAFWIPTEYPQVPPIVFVVPTSNMLVRPGLHADTNGKVYHPYLHGWCSRPEDCNILGLCTILQSTFSQNPPLITKPNSGPPPPSVPERPVKPNTLATPALNSFKPKSPTPPPLPPPPPYQPSATNVQQSATIVNGPRNRNGNSSPVPNPRHQTQPLTGQLSIRATSAPPQTSSSPPPLQNQISNILDSPPPPITQTSPTNLVNNQSPEIIKLQIEVYEKVEARCRSYQEQAQQEIEKITTQSEKLNDNERSIELEKQQLMEISKKLQEKINVLEVKCAEVDRLVEQANNMPEVSVDDILCGTTIVYNQIFELVAEDNAIEDTIYYLGKALNTERIDLQTFMKNIRTLAREQFMRRALIKKARKQAGLDK